MKSTAEFLITRNDDNGASKYILQYVEGSCLSLRDLINANEVDRYPLEHLAHMRSAEVNKGDTSNVWVKMIFDNSTERYAEPCACMCPGRFYACNHSPLLTLIAPTVTDPSFCFR